MTFSLHVPKFIKKNFSFKEEEERNASAASSIYSYMSAPVSDPNDSFHRDPMRCGNQPSVVGYYYDPMGGKFSFNHGVDPTNTGA